MNRQAIERHRDWQGVALQWRLLGSDQIVLKYAAGLSDIIILTNVLFAFAASLWTDLCISQQSKINDEPSAVLAIARS